MNLNSRISICKCLPKPALTFFCTHIYEYMACLEVTSKPSGVETEKEQKDLTISLHSYKVSIVKDLTTPRSQKTVSLNIRETLLFSLRPRKWHEAFGVRLIKERFAFQLLSTQITFFISIKREASSFPTIITEGIFKCLTWSAGFCHVFWEFCYKTNKRHSDFCICMAHFQGQDEGNRVQLLSSFASSGFLKWGEWGCGLWSRLEVLLCSPGDSGRSGSKRHLCPS